METTEIILVTLANDDSAMYVNGEPVYTLDGSESGASPVQVGTNLANALGVTPVIVEMEVPTDSDWNWADVYELLPPSSPGAGAAHEDAFGQQAGGESDRYASNRG